MRSERPVVHALLMTTAAAWSIGAHRAGKSLGQAPAQFAAGSSGARPPPGPVVLTLRRVPPPRPAGGAGATDKRGAA